MDFCRDANLGYAFVNLVKLGSEMVGWFRVGSWLGSPSGNTNLKTG